MSHGANCDVPDTSLGKLSELRFMGTLLQIASILATTPKEQEKCHSVSYVWMGILLLNLHIFFPSLRVLLALENTFFFDVINIQNVVLKKILVFHIHVSFMKS